MTDPSVLEVATTGRENRVGGDSVEVCGVSHWFRRPKSRPTQVLVDVSFEVSPGEFVCLVGPSGCGKTTMLNMIAGLLRPLQGEVLVGREEATAGKAPKVGYVLARDGMLPWRTTRRNVEFGLELGPTLKVSRGERRARASEWLHRVGLGDFGESYPWQLSQGMRQRAALARTLARRPAVLAMDEPFGALDAQTRLTMQQELLRLWREEAMSVVFVTHDVGEATVLADRVIVFSSRPGRITLEVPIGIPQEERGNVWGMHPEIARISRRLVEELFSGGLAMDNEE